MKPPGTMLFVQCAILFIGIGMTGIAGAAANNGAADPSTFRTIVLVSMTDCCVNAAYPEAEQALVEELSLLGIPVTRVLGKATDETAQRQELETLARQHRAAASIRLARPGSDGRADATLWITDQITKKTVFRSNTQFGFRCVR